jgi:hypothetical protein
MAGSLNDPIARIKRAVHHYHALKDSFHGVDRKFRPVRVERDREGLEYRFYVGEIEAPNSDWSLMLGDAYHNLRAALDNLVFQLHVRHYRGKVPDAVEKTSAFPVFEVPDTFKTTGLPIPTDRWKTIQNLGRAERATIEWLQPYHGRDRHYPPRTVVNQIRRGIHDVDRLDKIDKHRNLHLANIAMTSIEARYFEARFGFKNHPTPGVAVESHALVDRWTFREAPPPQYVPMETQIGTVIAIDPRIDPDPLPLDALPHLGGCIWAINLALDRFRGRFPTAEVVDLSTVHMSWG